LWRVKAPHVALEILTAPWCRFWPTAKTFNWLLLFFYKEAERHALTTPLTKEQNSQQSNEKKTEEKSSSQDEEQEQQEKALDKILTIESPEFHLTYEKTLNAMCRHFKLQPNKETYSLMAAYHAIRGEFEQHEKFVNELINRKWDVGPMVYSGKMLGLIRLGKSQEAIQYYEDITTRIGTNGNKMRLKIFSMFRKCAMAAYLLLNDTEAAYKVLQTTKYPTNDFVFIHFGDSERAKVVQSLFERLQKETNTQLSEDIKKALADPFATSQISETEKTEGSKESE
jgi:hypothetical protein